MSSRPEDTDHAAEPSYGTPRTSGRRHNSLLGAAPGAMPTWQDWRSRRRDRLLFGGHGRPSQQTGSCAHIGGYLRGDVDQR